MKITLPKFGHPTTNSAAVAVILAAMQQFLSGQATKEQAIGLVMQALLAAALGHALPKPQASAK